MKSAVQEKSESRLIDCPSCDARISKRAHACPKCGALPWVECRVCGAKIRAESSTCPECGDPDPFNPW